MTTNHLRRAALLAMIALLAPRAIAQDTLQPAEQPEHAPVFSDLSPAEAGRLASKEGKLLIIKGTAVWCGPCKQMDRTTFRDQRIIDWIDLYAVAVELDVDERPGGAKALRISAMPTIIAFKGKTEIDRVVGYQSADDLLVFFQNVRAGKTRAQRVAEETESLKKRAEGGDMDARYARAEQLLRAEAYEEATEEYVWLWSNILEHGPSYAGVRGSFMAGRMEELAAAHPPARDRFAGLRDALESGIRPGDDFDRRALSDWIVLNEVIGDEQRTREWIDRIAERSDAANYFAYEPRVFDVLLRQGRWELAGRTLGPVEYLLARLERVDLSEEPFSEPSYFAWLVGYHAERYAALLAADRTGEACQLAEALLKVDDSEATRAALAAKATAAGIPEEERRAWESD